MQINVKDIEYNRFRDLKLNPINDDHVDVLADSIKQLGFFSGITVRPLSKGKYEAAAGHHRFEAARVAGIKLLEAVVQDYSDEQMVAIMVKENATQRGGNALATLDSVAATSRILAKEILLGEGNLARSLAGSEDDKRILAGIQAQIAKEGLGWALIYQAINGFDYEERKDDTKTKGKPETMSKGDIEVALGQLKDSGYMAGLMGQVYAEVEAIRIEQRKKDEAERKRLEAEEMAKERAAIEAEQRAAEAAKRAAEAKRKFEEAKQQADKERAKRAAEESERRAKAAKEAEAERKKREEEADKARDDRLKLARETEQRSERERQQKKQIEEQKAERRVYDLEAGQVFNRPSHQQAFKAEVMSARAQIHIKKHDQLALAKYIREEMDKTIKRGDGSSEHGTGFIKQVIQERIEAGEAKLREATAAEEKLKLLTSAKARVDKRWDNIRRSVNTIETELMMMEKDLKEWEFDKSLFPMRRDVIRLAANFGRRFQHMAKRIGIDI